jgi:predicted transcriptional regulator
MLEPLLGSTNRERVLMFLIARNQGYAREIARFFGTDLDPIQKQLEKLEAGGVLYSHLVGKTRMYAFNPRYPFLSELKTMLGKAMSFYPQNTREALLMNRRRPRRRGKPL